MSRTALGLLIDEIYILRAAAAYEAKLLETHLAFKTYPAGRADVTVDQLRRLRLIAGGRAEYAYAGFIAVRLDTAVRDAEGIVLPYEAGAEVDVRRARAEATAIRRGLAYEAGVLRATATVPGVPVTAKKLAVVQADRLVLATRGEADPTYYPFGTETLKAAFRHADINPNLTNHQWLQESPLTREAR